MAIPVKRWESLDKDFNVGVQDFSSIGKEIGGTFNTAMASANELAGEIKGVLTDLKGLKDDALGQAMDALKSATRFADDALGTFTDLAKLPESVLDSVIKSILPDGSLSSAAKLKSTIKTCRNNALGRGLGLSGKNLGVGCGNGKFRVGNCASNASTTQGLLDDIFGNNGLLGQASKAVANVLRKIVSLASLGYGADLCGVFAAATNGVKDKGLLTMAAGNLLNSVGLDGNFKAVGDIAKNLTGLNVTALMPSTLANIAQHIPMPLDFNKNSVGAFGESVTSILGEVDSEYITGTGGYALATGKLGAINDVVSRSWGDYASSDLDLNSFDAGDNDPICLASSSYKLDDYVPDNLW